MNSVTVRLNTPNHDRKVSSDGRFGPRANSRTSRSRYALVRPPIRATAASSPTTNRQPRITDHESQTTNDRPAYARRDVGLTVRVSRRARGVAPDRDDERSDGYPKLSRHSAYSMTSPTYGARLVPDCVDKG